MTDRQNRTDPDAFWDLASLMPARRESAKQSPAKRDTEAVEITSSVTRDPHPYRVEESILTEHYVAPRLAREAEKPTPLLAYTPTECLLHEVRIYPWRTQYEYYEAFRRHAHAFLSREGTKTESVEFFSYMPQYAQMSAAQLAYYFWWRTNFRRGNCLAADYSYLLLYLYELINVGDAMEPAQVQEAMVRLWLSYRGEHPRLDALVREWLCDYSLLYRLPAPSLPVSLYRELLAGCRLKEYYVPLEGDGDALVSAVLLFCNNYDYTKSKFFTSDTAEDYHRVLRGAVRVAIDHLRERDGNILTGGTGVSTVSRDTFTGAICSYRLKRRIEIDYTSFSHTHELRYIMSDVLKYAENALRAAKGIKSRLTVYAVEVPLREKLDAYLVGVLPKKAPRQAAKKEEEIPAYERRYDLPVTAPSPERAAEIEALSWQTTKALVEAFEGEEAETDGNGADFAPNIDDFVSSVSAPSTPPDSPTGLCAALGELCEFVRLAAACDAAAQRAWARNKGRMPDAIVDEINTVAGDIFGDIILEEADGAFVLIEDYRDQLEEEGVLSYGK